MWEEPAAHEDADEQHVGDVVEVLSPSLLSSAGGPPGQQRRQASVKSAPSGGSLPKKFSMCAKPPLRTLQQPPALCNRATWPRRVLTMT